MSFWNLSDGTNASSVGTEYEKPSGNLDPIPNGSTVLAMIDEAKWDNPRDDDAQFVSLRWSVVAPEEFKNRKLFQKLWVQDFDPRAKDTAAAEKKRDKDRRMLAAIDANCGGKLVRKAAVPTDEDMTLALTNKPMVIKVMVWSMPDRESPGQTIEGNWIAAVAPKDRELVTGKTAPPKPQRPMGGGKASLDDDIPFSAEWR